MRWLLITLFIINGICVDAQENLVQNPSFEEITNCPANAYHILYAPPWRKVGGGGSLLHECGYSGYGIPENIGGGGYARTGLAHCGITGWVNHDVLAGYVVNFVGIPFVSALKEDQLYNVEFYVSLYDSMWYAIKNMGIHFSEVQPPNDINHLLGLVPQVEYEGTEFLDDKEGWMQIAGSFIAQGGEKFLTIGNFDGSDSSEVVFVGGGVPPPFVPEYWALSYYYIDDVSLMEDTSTLVTSPKPKLPSISVYPNPTAGVVRVSVQRAGGENLYVSVRDAFGRMVCTKAIESSSFELNVQDWSQGIYVVELSSNGATVARTKMVVQ